MSTPDITKDALNREGPLVVPEIGLWAFYGQPGIWGEGFCNTSALAPLGKAQPLDRQPVSTTTRTP